MSIADRSQRQKQLAVVGLAVLGQSVLGLTPGYKRSLWTEASKPSTTWTIQNLESEDTETTVQYQED